MSKQVHKVLPLHVVECRVVVGGNEGCRVSLECEVSSWELLQLLQRSVTKGQPLYFAVPPSLHSKHMDGQAKKLTVLNTLIEMEDEDGGELHGNRGQEETTTPADTTTPEPPHHYQGPQYAPHIT